LNIGTQAAADLRLLAGEQPGQGDSRFGDVALGDRERAHREADDPTRTGVDAHAAGDPGRAGEKEPAAAGVVIDSSTDSSLRSRRTPFHSAIGRFSIGHLDTLEQGIPPDSGWHRWQYAGRMRALSRHGWGAGPSPDRLGISTRRIHMSVVKQQSVARHRAADLPDHSPIRVTARPQHRGGVIPLSMVTWLVGAAAVLVALAVVVAGIVGR
jgi:hypothetical protein